MSQFSKYNRIFISKEVDSPQFPFKTHSIILFSCSGTIKDKPIYSLYDITLIKWTDGSNLQNIKSCKLYDIVEDENTFTYYENEWKEIDKSFESTFWMMWENVDIMNKMSANIKKNFKTCSI